MKIKPMAYHSCVSHEFPLPPYQTPLTPLLLTPKTLPPTPTHSLYHNHHKPPNRNLRPPTEAMNSASSNRMFQLNFDSLTGASEWVVVDENDDRPTAVDLATTSYLDMLNDTRRNVAYRLAIDKTVTRPCHVLDIGAGTGLLSMMAARAMGLADEDVASGSRGRVTGCESYLPMLKLMRKVLRQNGLERKVHTINKRSDELNVGIDINTRADVLVSEILDSELLGEGLIPTLQHAHDELLVASPQTVPYRATTFGQLVESGYLWRLHDLYNNEVCTTDSIHLVPSEVNPILQVKTQQHPLHCDSLGEEIKLLSAPFKIFEFDFWKRPDSHRDTELHIKATGCGRVNAVISWWILQLDQEGTVFYSTAPKWIKEQWTEFPGGSNWCDHWKQCVWFVPGQGVPVARNENVYFHAAHTDIGISYQLDVQSHTNWSQCTTPNTHFHLIFSPEKIAMYSDDNWRRAVLTAVEKALRKRDCHLCYVADDSIFLATAVAHLCKLSQIMLLFPGLREKGLQYLQATAETNHFSVNRFKLLEHQSNCMIMPNSSEQKVDLFVGEPFYYGFDTKLPWKNLRFWKERTRLESMLSKDTQTIPGKGILCVCAMSLPDLWRSRRSLTDIEGFDHSVANATLGACGDLSASEEGPMLPCFIWQCGEIKELSENLTLMEFDFSKPMSSCTGKTMVEFTKSGICHGFVFWIDWVLDAEDGNIVSTGPDNRLWRQGVKLLPRPVAVSNQDGRQPEESYMVKVAGYFEASTANLVIQHDFMH